MEHSSFTGAVIVLVILFGINVPAFWVFRKAGWSGWWFLLLPVPLVGLVVLYVFAFRQWPAERGQQNAKPARVG